ncbi:uncharacterized protein C1orf167 homolog isoform X3 [Serinus canaria]|uniref:uncharacterized protein C1orf167 homolog isoform X3 n=1 Tax=Serinus canaria TaxID=9135 RepID=UPI0008DB6A74|nr:uncharacterized protein C1orf167 homolog isoform X3 [Serinus canaria]
MSKASHIIRDLEAVLLWSPSKMMCATKTNSSIEWSSVNNVELLSFVCLQISENSFWSLKVNEQSFWHLRDKQILRRCFQAWRRYILWKRAATQLYRHQLLQKGFGALQWLVHQRRSQLEVAQQRHASTLLAASFQRWKEAMAKQSQKKALQPEPYSYTQSLSAGIFGVGRLATMTTSAQHQPATGYSKEVEQAYRMEGELWTQLRHRQRGDEFCWGVEAIRDMRQLAAAFRLWRLQKELLSKEEARLLEAHALLEKKKLRNIFWMWHSQSLEMKEILRLTTQIQRNLVSRCFSTWKETVEQKALDRCNLAHLRAVSLRKHFQQWVEMLQVRGGDKLAVVNLFLLRWRQHYGAVMSSVADKSVTKRHEGQTSWTGERQFLEKTVYSFDDFCQKLKLQRVYLLWKTRLCEHHKADSFSQTLEQNKLRKTLKLWHQKYLMLKTIEQSSKHLHRAVNEEPLARLFSEDLSTSSGFDSSAPATLTSQSSLEKECSLSDSSQHGFSSPLTAEDVTHMSCHSSFLQLHQCTELPAELCLQSSFPASGRNWFVGNQFHSSVLQSPDNNSQPLTSYSAWEEGCSSDKEVKSCWQQAEQCCLQRCFIFWSAQTRHHVKAQQHCRRVQLSRAFLSWHHWVMENKNQKAAAALKHGVHCVQMAFSLWKRRLAQKVEVDRRFRCHVHQMTADALWHWHSCCQRKRALGELQQQWAWHSCQEKKRLVLQTWYHQTRKQKYAVLFWERFLLHRCLVAWAQVTACKLRQHEALSYFKRVREHRLLVGSFIKWRDKLWRAEQVPGGRNHKWQEPSPGKACHRWRVAARGQQALRLGSVATVKQACNYWTRAAAFSQCLRQRSTLIGVRKSRKMSLSWPTKSRRGREEDSAPTGHFPSAIQRWLVIYRSQNRAERLLERPDVVGPSHAHAKIQENAAEVDLEEWAKKSLGRRYLKRWHHTAVLRRCQHDRKLLCLARGWHQWREASRVVILAQVLDQQRLIEKAWRVWRQRYLQSCVVQNLLKEEARSLLSQAFGRWWQLTAFQCKDKGSC